MRNVLAFIAAALVACAAPQGNSPAEEALVTYKSVSADTAIELAQAALAACRARCYQVAVAVVDRFGQPQVMLRDRFAGPHTSTVATDEAWTAVSFRSNTSDLIRITQPGQPQAGLRNIPHVVLLGGGVAIEAGGSSVGAVGVSGAPGGDEDEACAKAGIEAVRERLEFQLSTGSVLPG
jgi:uncharacterized protein GlcG (DUF336 family)